MSGSRVVVVGSLNMDLVGLTPRLPAPGETLHGSAFFQTPGGKGANQAYAAAVLGGSVAMLGRVGEDDFGARLKANLLQAGCDEGAVREVPGPSGVALILLTASAQNSIVVIPGANAAYGPPEFERDAAALAGAGLVLLQLETPLDTVTAAAKAARTVGARVILDPAPAIGALPADLMAHIDILTPNEVEACQLLGRAAGPLTVDEARAIADQLIALGPGAVVIKLGAQGCLLVEPAGAQLIAAPAVQAVDTTGAGDVFNGALAVALSEGALLPSACRFAVHAAALSVTRLGAQSSMPARAQVDAFIAQAKT